MNRVRRTAVALAVLVMATSGAAVSLAGPAAAASCYHRSGYTFEVKYETTYNIMWVYKGSTNDCSGDDYIGWAKVTNVSVGKDVMYVEDTKCDGIGIYGYTHGYSAHPSGCDHSDSQKFDLANVGSPKNWWLNVGGTVNSNAESLPA